MSYLVLLRKVPSFNIYVALGNARYDNLCARYDNLLARYERLFLIGAFKIQQGAH